MYAGNWDGRVTPELKIGRDRLTIIAGPCMFESYELGLRVGRFLKGVCERAGVQYVFKSSYDKANRTSATTARGPGLDNGLAWLARIRAELAVPVLTDVHTPAQALEAGQIVDIVQVPAFLCNQRELLAACAQTGKTVQIKKGQHSAPEELVAAAHYMARLGNPKVLLCERGTAFGYNNLVVDYRNLVEMGAQGHAVVFDGTHAAMLPGAGAGQSSGLRHVVPALTRAAVGLGVDALFLEVHENPENALSDAATQLPFSMAEEVIMTASRLSNAMR